MSSGSFRILIASSPTISLVEISGPGDACRLFVYLARDAPMAVVLSRGPTDWAQLSLWHTDTDTLEHGQWIKGRVYERRSDVSSDGSLFCGFVRQSGGREDNRADTWIAVSRPPYFSALAVWFVARHSQLRSERDLTVQAAAETAAARVSGLADAVTVAATLGGEPSAATSASATPPGSVE